MAFQYSGGHIKKRIHSLVDCLKPFMNMLWLIDLIVHIMHPPWRREMLRKVLIEGYDIMPSISYEF